MSDRVPATVVWAMDLTTQPGYRDLWFPGGATSSEQTSPAGLPGSGVASPMGYWLYTRDGVKEIPRGLLVVRVHTRSDPLIATATPGRARHTTRPARTVSLRARAIKDSEILLIVGTEEAHVFATRIAWDAMSEAILLAVTQYWRFHCVELELERLGALARDAGRHAVMPNLATWRQGRQLAAWDRQVRDLVYDWVHFAGPLSDPSQYCSSEIVLEEYHDLSEGLGLEGWAERLDDLVEVVAESWEMITEKLLHYKLFVWGLILELIVIGLIAGLYFYP